MPDVNYETIDDIITLTFSHNQSQIVPTPFYSAVRLHQHPDFLVALRAARSDLPISRDGERLANLDIDLANDTASPDFTRLSSAIDHAAQRRRFNP